MFPIREIKRLDFIKENSKAENINNIDMTETEDKELAENLNLCFLWHVLSVLITLLPKYSSLRYEAKQNLRVLNQNKKEKLIPQYNSIR